MKEKIRIFCLVFLPLFCLLTACDVFPFPLEGQDPAGKGPNPGASAGTAAPHLPEEWKAVWISYYELGCKDMSQKEFENKVDSMYNNVVQYGFNTVIVHVRAFADAIYPSKLFPFAANCLKSDGSAPDYDPLDILVSSAHTHGLRFEAWVNPFRISLKAQNLAELGDSPAFLLGGDSILFCSRGAYFNPASEEARGLILDGIREILAYPVDGIHFDDYFYPTSEPSFDAGSFAAYQESGGKLPLEDWRRTNVDALVSSTYRVVKAKGEALRFGISPAASISRNRDGYFADVQKWCQTEGYLDYICPQVYFGFQHPTMAFEACCKQWEELCTADVDVYFGLAGYKLGTMEEAFPVDSPARTEWASPGDLIKRQVEYCRSLPKYEGYAVFSYQSIINQNNIVEFENLTE